MNRIEQIRLFLKDRPNDCFLKHALALECVKLGNEEEAKKWFLENREQDPSYLGTYYHLAQLLERQDEEEQAIAIYEEGMAEARRQNDQHTFRELKNACDLLRF